MLPWFSTTFGNAASAHPFGWAAADAVSRAAAQVGALLHMPRTVTGVYAPAPAIVWTSGATESNNLAIKGVAAAYGDKGRHIITQVTEHKAVLDPTITLRRAGFDVTYLPVDRGGRVTADQVAAAIRPDTILTSIMWANNEIGTLQPIREIGRVCRERGVLFHTDATQAVGRVPVDVQADNIDLLSFSGHKLYGPKGCGVLYVRPTVGSRQERIKLAPLLDGGGHQGNMRSGTLNVPGIVGVGAACEIAQAETESDAARLAALRDRLESGIVQCAGVSSNGDPRHRLPHACHFSFDGIPGEVLMGALDDLAVSAGSACSSGSEGASYVVKAIGADAPGRSTLRFSLGRSNTIEEVDYAIDRVTRALASLRSIGL